MLKVLFSVSANVSELFSRVTYMPASQIEMYSTTENYFYDMLLYQGNYSVENSNLYTFEIKIFRKLLDVLCDRGCYSAGKKYNLQLAT